MTLLERLRTETRVDHVRVETALDLLSSHLTLDRYGWVIQRLHAFVHAWEPLVEQVLGGGFYRPRRKQPWLDQDLRMLGLSPLPMAVPLPRITTRPQALGSLYVMEGGTLGGQVILRHLRALGLEVDGATRYFASYGTDVGRRWTDFRAVLLAASGPGHDAAIVAAARETFACLSAVMALPAPEFPLGRAAVPATVPAAATACPVQTYHG